jgi:hypothetical protein
MAENDMPGGPGAFRDCQEDGMKKKEDQFILARPLTAAKQGMFIVLFAVWIFVTLFWLPDLWEPMGDKLIIAGSSWIIQGLLSVFIAVLIYGGDVQTGRLFICGPLAMGCWLAVCMVNFFFGHGFTTTPKEDKNN